MSYRYRLAGWKYELSPGDLVHLSPTWKEYTGIILTPTLEPSSHRVAVNSSDSMLYLRQISNPDFPDLSHFSHYVVCLYRGSFLRFPPGVLEKIDV